MIRGKKIGLRAVEQEDLNLLRDWRNIEEFRRNFREFRELNMAMQEKWFTTISESRNDFMFVIERLKDKKPLGVCGLVYVNWIIRCADLSFYIGFENKYIDQEGYAEEATRVLLNYAFGTLNLHKVWTELYEFDEKKVDFFTKKFHFKKDGTLRDNCFDAGQYWNSYIFSLLADEYLK